MGGVIDTVLPIPKILSLHDSGTLRVEEMLKCSESVSEKLYCESSSCTNRDMSDLSTRDPRLSR